MLLLYNTFTALLLKLLIYFIHMLKVSVSANFHKRADSGTITSACMKNIFTNFYNYSEDVT